MELGDAIGVGIVTAFWFGLEVYLLVNRPLAEGLALRLGVPDGVLEGGLFILGLLATWGVHKAAE